MGGNRIRVVRPEERQQPAERTPGMDREQAFAGAGVWVGYVRTEPGQLTGWHHHGDYDTYIYVLRGNARMDTGPGGREQLETRPGDFIHVPKGVIHREGSASADGVEAILLRVGSGQVTFNTDGPEPDEGTPPGA